jgi:hypothetical protein
VPRAEVTINRPVDSIATAVVNPSSVQHIPTYSSTPVDASTSDHIEHYHSHSTDDV